MSEEYFHFRHAVTTDDMFSNVDRGLSHTCRSNARLSSDLQNFIFHDNLRKQNEFRTKYFRSQHPILVAVYSFR